MVRINRTAKRRRNQVETTQQSELYQSGAGLRGGEARARLRETLWKRKLAQWSRVGDNAEKLEALKRADINLEEFDFSSVFGKDGDGVEGDASTEPPFVLETGGETFRVHAPPRLEPRPAEAAGGGRQRRGPVTSSPRSARGRVARRPLVFVFVRPPPASNGFSVCRSLSMFPSSAPARRGGTGDFGMLR